VKASARILVCFALGEEAVPFRKLAAGRPGVEILITGIGSKNAVAALGQALGAQPPEQVLSCGFAGALDPRLDIGAVVFRADERELGERLVRAGAKAAAFHCADHIATTAAEKQRLRKETGADAVEMESEVIHSLCRERRIPCATVRSISDRADEDLPLDFNALARPDLSLDFGKLALAIAKSPGRIGGLLKLRRQSRVAARSLARVLDAILAGGKTGQ
jgi:adenosylhomocysteine nucleosidase